jgi:TolB-like protein/Tfp pilus assembly protein PilF
MSVEPLTFGPFRLNPENATLSRDGVLVPIGQKGALILAALSTSVGEVLTKTQLIDAAWRGMAVEESNLSVQIAALRKALGKTPGGGEWIVTVPRVGYRLYAEAGASARATSTGPPRLSIVVLPFANIGSDPEQDYFVDGVAECLTTDLSRIRGSFVVGRHTAFTYKGKAIDLKQIGRELNVRYVLEGSIQRSGDRMRVNAQLVDTESGNHLWAERFDKSVADIFQMQDEIVARLARQLDAALIAAEARRAERAPHPDSTDLYFQGMSRINRDGFSAGNLKLAQPFFERALKADRDNVDALAWSAFVDVQLVVTVTLAATERAERFASAEAAAARALLLAPDHAWARVSLSFVLGFTNRIEQAISECERALTLDPNLAMAHAVIGLHKLHLDRGEETEVHVREAIRLSPRDPRVNDWLGINGYAKDSLGRCDEAVTWLRRSIQANGGYETVYFNLAAALSHLGRVEEARDAARRGLDLNPHFTVSGFLTANTFSDSPAHRAWRERQAKGMREAGIPER